MSRADESAGRLFFDRGVQYYVAARFSVFAHLNPVCGNLFHHAVEMFLKGHLSHLGLSALRKFSHSLPDIWEQFKNDVADAALDRFDGVIAELHKFDSLRYPDRALKEGMASHIELVAMNPPPSALNAGVPVFRLVVPEIDDLVRVIFDKASVNPAFFTSGLNADAREYLRRAPTATLLSVPGL